MNYIVKSSIRFPLQHRFQSGCSTFMPLLSMEDQISSVMVNNEYSIGILLDLDKALATVDHSV